MNKAEIIDGYERIMHKASYTKSLLKEGEFEKALIGAKNLVDDSTYYLKHLGAFSNARKSAIKSSKKGRASINGIKGVKRKAKKKSAAKIKLKRKPTRAKKAIKPILSKPKAKTSKRKMRLR